MDRYLRLTLDADGRIVLPANLLSHLQAIDASAVRLVARDGRLWLWSEEHWQARQMGRFQDLVDALEAVRKNHLPTDAS
ncbi:division/cell wall cluster transcriptional repressor MraZ [Nitrospirillum iridis]|uniref:DNA-binding transcriptional regulator/RsmH inhibitor MraZ n=1 Tax=Nitrospirillum iridis TaxID=765888 RepID=A0A7X0B5I5_9PROT|nr:division/cell wall cluster transcriptional repressor MraZ [Nitrospirillum iridis]MBB6254841.1 DNA-binding transcriptional regulator/RsmH inhibitor MraZ [Nitrospirillum iridis]